MNSTAVKPVLRVLVAYLKGGAGKSTTVMMLAFALARRGKNVLVIDADAGTQGVTDWASRFYAENPDRELPFDIVQWSPRLGLLVPFIQQQLKETGADVVLLDVGGEAPEVVQQAAHFADVVLGTTQPTQADLGRMDATRTVLQKVKNDLPFLVSLNRVSYIGAGAALDARQGLEEAGITVLATEIENNRGKYADIWGRNPTHLYQYGPLADELLGHATKKGRAA